MRSLRSLTVAGALAGAIGCGGPSVSMRVDDGMLTGIPAAALAPVDKAGRAFAESKDIEAVARKELAMARYELERAKAAHAVTTARLDAAETLVDEAEETEDERVMAEASSEMQALRALEDADEKHIEYREEALAYADLNHQLAMARRLLQDASHEAARAEALSASASEAKDGLLLAEYKRQVADAHGLVSELESDAASQHEDTEEAKKDWESARANVPGSLGVAAKALASSEKDKEKLDVRIRELTLQVDKLRAENDKLKRALDATEAAAAEALTPPPAPVPAPGAGSTEATKP